MDILCKQEFVQTIVIMEPWGSRPSCAGSFATLIRGLVVRTGADGSRRSLRRLMNYDNVAPEGESLLQYLLGCADTEFGGMKEEDGERPVIVADCDHTSFSSAILSLLRVAVFVISYTVHVRDTFDRRCSSGFGIFLKIRTPICKISSFLRI